ncbi:hypothetical protein CN918_29840 [Priestia megaterium]|nr:hypothetical protein CN918_29840 [Priestia megaterium]
MLDSLNKRLQRLMPILTPISLVLGVLFQDVGGHLLFLVPWLFAFMTLVGSLSMNVKDVKSFSKYPVIILISIAFLHILMPVWAYFLSTLIFNNHLLTIGFIISVAVPTGVTSVIWVSICRGNLPLCLSIILIDTLLSPFIMPGLLHIVVGESIAIDTSSLILDLVWMIVLPTIVGIVLNELTKGKIHLTLGKKLAPFSKLSLFAVVMINSSAIAPYLKHITWELFWVILVVLFLAITGYAIALVIGRLIWKDPRIVTTFVFIGGMRNIAVGVIVATTYFPAKVAMPVVFGMLFQQVLASLFSKVVEKYQLKYESAST